MFRYALLKDALIAATAQGVVVTDEASAVELAGFKPRIVEGSPSNIKITRPEDLSLAAYYLQRANTIQQKENISCE
jgi:2-C-methyl-D-erythritol 4-phosphate cytidylyltransferase